MIATLLEVKGWVIRFYSKNDVYVKPVLKFLLALASFFMMNAKIGFMQQLRNPLVAAALSLLCAFLPINGLVVIAGVMMIAHAFALSVETCAVVAGLLALMYLLYFRISSKFGILLVLAPIAYLFGIPYVIPLVGGLVFGTAAAVPAACGAVVYPWMCYLSQNSTSLGTGENAAGEKAVSVIESIINNKEMFLCVLAMALTVLVVYFIKRLSVDHSWEIAIGVGTVLNIVIHLLGALLPDVTLRIVPLLFGSVVSALIAFAVKFFVFSVDYTRTERVQFEDDEYYYYVKAIPKNVIAESKKTVKKIVTQKKQTKTIKRIES